MHKPQLTLKILFYAVFDVLGMLVFASGATWLAKGQVLFLKNLPGNTFEALLMSAAGLALMLWAAAQILRELVKHPHKEGGQQNK